MRDKTVVLQGRSISGGLAVGYAETRLEDPSVVPVYHLGEDHQIDEEISLFRAAMSAADGEAHADETWARDNLPESEAEIFAAQRAILRDPTLADWVEGKIRTDRLNAAAAVRHRFDDFRAILQESSSEIIRNRILDVSDAERTILAHLLGHAREDSDPGCEGPAVLVTLNPPPSILARVDPDKVVGIVCEQGAGMGHIAVLARALNLPALIQVEGLLAEVRDGDTLTLDGDTGQIVVNPQKKELEEFQTRMRRHRILLPPRPADPRAERTTADGKRIYLLVNAMSQREVDAAADVDADGIGLYRTEFLYLGRHQLPTESELVSVYSEAAYAFTSDPIDFRLLDLGSDKHLSGTRALSEANPALGLRSLRFLFENPTILRTQVRAVLQAAAEGPARLLLPMVAGVEDIRKVRAVVAECHEELRREGLRHNPDLPVGAMIEHPAGVVMASEILREADFVSVGTNDLTMYLLAVDRDAAHLSGYYDVFHPAVIRTLRHLTRCAEEAGRPLSLCGELAGDPSLTGFLIGLGFSRLSMAVQWILPVGQVVSGLNAAEWAEITEEVSTFDSAQLIRKRVRAAVRDRSSA